MASVVPDRFSGSSCDPARLSELVAGRDARPDRVPAADREVSG
jgi:hypothetical protein